MITPRFRVEQDDVSVTVYIRVPNSRVGEMDFMVSGCSFKFSASPYFLRLTFPHDLVEDGTEKASYDVDECEIIVRLPKAERGRFFPNLGMVTALLAGGDANNTTATIEEMDEDDDFADPDIHGPGGDIDWAIRQKLPEAVDPITAPKYGFGCTFSNAFADLGEASILILELPNPDHIPRSQRRATRVAAEDEKFDPDYYCSDLYDSLTMGSLDDVVSWRWNPPRGAAGTVSFPGDVAPVKAPNHIIDLNISSPNQPPSAVESSKIQVVSMRIDGSSDEEDFGMGGDVPDVEGAAGAPLGPDDSVAASGIVEISRASDHTMVTNPTGSSAAPSVAESILGGLRNKSVNLLTEVSSRRLSEGSGSGASEEKVATAPVARLPEVVAAEKGWAAHTEAEVAFSSEEVERLMQLPRRRFLVDPQEARGVWLVLVDILFSWCYEMRVSQGELNSESGWTIRNVSAALSYLEDYNDLPLLHAAQALSFRAICFPLFRHWGVVEAVWGDVARILGEGRRCVLKALLNADEVLRREDTAYPLSRLYTAPYCVWIQTASDEELARLASAVEELDMDEVRAGLPYDVAAMDKNVADAIEEES